MFPIHPSKEYKDERVAKVLSAIHSVSNPAIPFNPLVFKRTFGLENLLNYLWCDVALLVSTRQNLWEKDHSIVPIKIWNCVEPMIRDEMKVLELKAGGIKEDAKLMTYVYQWLTSDEAYSNTALI